MEFVSLVGPKGRLWKAWVACHFERRLKRHDYEEAKIKDTCDFIRERLGVYPLRCIGHLMLGIVRLLYRQVCQFEERSQEVHNALLTSLSQGPGLPTVATLSASAVTLRHNHGAEVHPLELGVSPLALDMLMEPELPALEVEASLEEGRRHVAPMELITINSPGPGTPVDLPPLEGLADDDFPAPSPEELASMAAVGQAALQMVPEEDHPAPAAEDASSLPPVDFLLGGETSPAAYSPPVFDPSAHAPEAGEGDVHMEGDADDAAALAAAAEAEATAALDAVPMEEDPLEPPPPPPPMDILLGGEAREPSEAVTPTPKRVIRALEFDTPVVSPGATRQHGPPPARSSFLARLMELSPPRPPNPSGRGAIAGAIANGQVEGSALAVIPEPPVKRRRRKAAWLDEATTITERKYNDTSGITRANPHEYSIFLPHRNFLLGMTTTLNDLCPVLCEPFLQAADVGKRRREARAQAAARAAAAAIQGGPAEPGQASVPPASPPGLEVPEGSPVLPSPPPLPAHEPVATPARSPASPHEPPASPLEAQAVAASEAEADVEHPAATASEVEVEQPAPTASEVEIEEAEVEPPAVTASEAEDHVVEMPELPSQDVTDMDVDDLPDPPMAGTATPRAADLPPGSPLAPVPPTSPGAPSPGAGAIVPAEATQAAQARTPVRQRPTQRGRPSAGAGIAAIQPPPPVQAQEDRSVDFATVSVRQGTQLRESMQEDQPLKFLELLDAEQCSAEVAACRFVDLLSLHMNGTVSLEQEEPYADIAIGRGSAWEAWCDEVDRRGRRRGRDETSDADAAAE